MLDLLVGELGEHRQAEHLGARARAGDASGRAEGDAAAIRRLQMHGYRIMHAGADARATQMMLQGGAIRHPHDVLMEHVVRAWPPRGWLHQRGIVGGGDRLAAGVLASRWRSFTRRIAACNSSSREFTPTSSDT